MGIDTVATAKEFEKHAESGYIPELLARELHNLSDTDRQAVARQISWDSQQNSSPTLPKIEFYDSGDLKTVERTGKSGSTDFTNRYEMDKGTGHIKSEAETLTTKSAGETYTAATYTEKDPNSGHLTYKLDTSTTIRGTSISTNVDEDRWAYDANTGKMKSHDEKTSWGRTVHDEYDSATGREKYADITTKTGKEHRTYDATTGNIRSSEIDNFDNTRQKTLYNSNGDKISDEKTYANKAVNRTYYSPRTGDEVSREHQDPQGNIERFDYDASTKKWNRM